MMKRFMQSVTAFLLILALSSGMVPEALAADGEVIFWGKSERFSFEPGSGYTATDMFAELKDVMPGDVLSETITVTNRSRDGDYIKLYLRAEPHSAKNPITYSEHYEYTDGKDQAGISGQRDETMATMEQFLSQLTLRICDGSTLIYEDSPDDAGRLTDNVYLGTLRRYRSLDINLELEVPVQLDNRYANRVGEVDWIFTAEVFDDPGKPDIPKTADMILGAVAVMTLSAMLLALLLVTRRRRK